ncbi:MAG: CopG family ribbon-helix-helix protein [Alphaproteobacteria bacterium]
MAKSVSRMVPVSSQIDAQTHAHLKELAERMDRPVEQLVADAIGSYVHYEREFIAFMEEGIAAANAGRLVDHGNVVTMLREQDRSRR